MKKIKYIIASIAVIIVGTLFPTFFGIPGGVGASVFQINQVISTSTVNTAGCVYSNGVSTSTLVATTTNCGGGSPGGSNTQVQYNNSGAFAGSSNLTFNGTSLTAGGSLTAGVNVLAGNKFAFSGDPTHSFLIGDGSNNVFLQSGAAISIVPFAGSNLNLAPSAGGIVYNSATKTGIGTSSPIAYVAIQPANNAIPTFVVASTTGSIPSLIVGKNGYVGIGTSSPVYPLTVMNSSSSLVPSIVVASSTIDGSHFGQLAFGVGTDSANSAADAEYIYNPLSGSGFTNVTRLFLGAPNHNFYVLNLSNLTSGIEGLATMAISGTYGSNNCYAFTDCSLSMSRDGNNIRFNDSFPGDATNAFTFNIGSEVARITQAGFGFGTTSPVAQLAASSAATTTLILDSTSGTQGGCIMMRDRDGVHFSYITTQGGVMTVSTTKCN